MHRLWLAALAVLACACAAGHAAEFKNLEVSYQNGVYQMHSEVLLDAPADEVLYVLTDYDHLTWITGAVLESQELDKLDANTTVFYMRIELCFAFFCQQVGQVLRSVEQRMDNGVLLNATALPQYSDVEFSETSWQILPTETGTRLIWKSRMKPKFWLPPIIGPAIVESELREHAHYTARGIEKLAREWAVVHGGGKK